MNFDDVHTAAMEARNIIERGDTAVRMLADLMCGRLRISRLGATRLSKLKRELRKWNMTTETWAND